jgi:periplasmic protein TonB
MKAGSVIEKSALFVGALAVNLGLYLLVPYIQVLILKNTNALPKGPKIVSTDLAFAPPPVEKLIKREIKEIKTQNFSPPQPTPTRPTNPGGGLKIDLSPAGGEGLSLVSGGDRTGGIGSGTGGGKGEGIAAMTYDPGQTDTDVKPLNSPQPNYPARAKRQDITGIAELSFVVNEAGTVEQILVLKEDPVGYGFAAAAIQCAKQTRFKPATLQKMSVRQRAKQTFRFGIEGQ